MSSRGRRVPQEDHIIMRDNAKYKPTGYFDSAADVPHNRYWEDREVIGIANGANWDLYIFKRTVGSKELDGGVWLSTGVTTGAELTGW